MKRNVLYLSMIAVLMSMAGTSCTEADTAVGDDSEEGIETGTTVTTDEEVQATLTITVRTGTNDDIVVSRESQTENEKALVSLNVYLFTLDSSVDEDEATDDDYIFDSSYTFTTDSDDESTLLTDSGTGTYTCTIDVTDLVNETVKIALIGNDTPATAPTAGTTTLSEFKTVVYSVTASDAQHVDVLVGYPEDDATGYPMSAMAVDSSDNEAVTLTSLGTNVEAELIRTMARVDVFNFVPNLSVTGVYVMNTPNSAYIFKQDSPASPDDAEFISLYAYSTYYDTYSEGVNYGSQTSTTDESTYLVQGYDDSFVDDLKEGYTDEEYEEARKDANTRHHVLYLNEQSVSSTDTSPVIAISYTIEEYNGGAEGLVYVYFQNSDTEEYLNVTRNTLYLIQIGDGNSIESNVLTIQLEITGWEQETVESIEVTPEQEDTLMEADESDIEGWETVESEEDYKITISK